MNWLKQSTAVTVQLGPYISSTDGTTEKTALGDVTVELSKNGGTFATNNSTTPNSHDAEGWYKVSLDATDTNTLGILKAKSKESNTLQVWDSWMVVPANVYDSLVSGSDYLDINMRQIGGSTQSQIDLKDFADAGYDPSTNEITGISTAGEDSLSSRVWDEVLTGGTHNITNSAGRRLRQIEAAFVLHNGTAQAGGTNTITLDTGASTADDFYNHQRIVITEGTGVEQAAVVVDYAGATRVATIAPSWNVTPDATSVFEVEPAICHAETGWATIKVGLAAAGASTTITLDANSSTVDNYYKDDVILLDKGTGEGQSRVVTAYVGSTKVATITPAWDITPDTTSEYIVEQAHAVTEINNDKTGYALSSAGVDDIWDEPLSDHNTAGTSGIYLRQIKEGLIAEESSVNDASATTTSFITNLTEASDSHYADSSIAFIDGALKGQSRTILSYTGATKTITLDEALTEAPADGDGFIILTAHVHSVSQIADAIWDENLAGHSTAGGAGKALSDLNSDWADGGRLDLILDNCSTAGTDNASTHSVAQIWTTTLTEAYSTAAFTGAQALYEIAQTLGESSIVSTTRTTKKRDRSTTALTATLNNSTAPTSITRAS